MFGLIRSLFDRCVSNSITRIAGKNYSLSPFDHSCIARSIDLRELAGYIEPDNVELIENIDIDVDYLVAGYMDKLGLTEDRLIELVAERAIDYKKLARALITQPDNGEEDD